MVETTARRAGRPLALLTWLVVVQQVQTQCPGMCSGHGDCGAENVCQCEAGYDVAPDCSLREFSPRLAA